MGGESDHGGKVVIGSHQRKGTKQAGKRAAMKAAPLAWVVCVRGLPRCTDAVGWHGVEVLTRVGDALQGSILLSCLTGLLEDARCLVRKQELEKMIDTMK
jgi:hypothetical protein